MNKSLLLAMSACFFSSASFAGINSDYHVVADDLTADHNESNGVPMPFYGNGRRLCCVIKFRDRATPFRVFLSQYDKFQAYLTQ
ncbi:hypothetical protein H5300_26985 [Vibrio sp. SG41-7]|uniref:hypothetical protein n=1 Tax=Vibrio sp. SG41-7 TaxID=2760973 RepID=UPI001600C914|nr:hypothetical protein [Vibrio sp. SG41-7]MBB1466787.1 hypothetical protein [Vibrio sp. SG41-7]